MLMLRGQKRLNGFKFDTFSGRFSRDGATSMALKGLINTKRRIVLPSHLKFVHVSNIRLILVIKIRSYVGKIN